MEESLKNKTVKGVGWSAIDNVTQYGVSFIVSIVLARLLTPDDYGLLGIVLIFTSVCTTIINGGFSTALIRKKNASNEDYNTTFLVNLCMSVLLYVVIFLFAPLISSFFHREELVALTRVASLGLIIGAISMVQQTRLTKRIEFKLQTKVTFFASLLSGGIGIGMALFGFGVWALIFQMLSSQSVRTILLWVYDKWIPQLRFSKNSFRDLFGFGWKMMLSGILDSVWKELYQVVVGRFYTPATLGQYTRSKGFAQLFSSNLTTVIQRVSYPVLSSIQDEKDRMVIAYRKLIKISMFISSISMFALGAVSEPLLYCLIGSQWYEAATYLPLICISASTYPLHALNLNMLEVQGRSDLFLGLEIIKKIVAVGPLAVGAFVGVMPMLYTNLIATVIAFFLNSHYSGKLIGYSSWMQIKDIASSYLIATLIAFSVFFLKYLPVSYWIVLPLQVVVGSIVFWIVCQKTHAEEFEELMKLLLPLRKKLKR